MSEPLRFFLLAYVLPFVVVFGFIAAACYSAEMEMRKERAQRRGRK